MVALWWGLPVQVASGGKGNMTTTKDRVPENLRWMRDVYPAGTTLYYQVLDASGNGSLRVQVLALDSHLEDAVGDLRDLSMPISVVCKLRRGKLDTGVWVHETLTPIHTLGAVLHGSWDAFKAVRIWMRRYTASELRELPTLATGQADSLKVDTGAHRVWICRVGIEDGMPYDDGVTVEELQDGRWVTVEEYEPRP